MLARRTKGTIVFVRAKKCFRNFKRSETRSQVCFRVEQSIPIFPETPFSPIFPSSINNNKKERGREKKKPFSQESTHGNKQRGNITLHLSTLRYYSEPPSLAWPTLFLSPLALHFPRVSFQLILLNRSFTSKKGSNYSLVQRFYSPSTKIPLSSSNVISNDAEFCSNFNFLIFPVPLLLPLNDPTNSRISIRSARTIGGKENVHKEFKGWQRRCFSRFDRDGS